MGSAETAVKMISVENGNLLQISDFLEGDQEYGPNLKVLPTNDVVRELQTILRDK